MESSQAASARPIIEYANVSKSLHIGLCRYNELGSEKYKDIRESDNDVESYSKFFKNELKYHRV